MKNVRFRKFCISWNNYPTEITLEELKENILKIGKIEYLILGFEEGEKEHTPHIQGYVRFKNAIMFESLRKCLDNKNGTYGYIEIAKGNDIQNYNYCSKQGNFIEYGLKQENEPITLEDIIDDILNDIDFIELTKKYSFYALYHYNDFRKLYNDIKYHKQILINKEKNKKQNIDNENLLKELVN